MQLNRCRGWPSTHWNHRASLHDAIDKNASGVNPDLTFMLINFKLLKNYAITL